MAKNFDNLSKEELIEYVNNLRRQLNNEKYGLYFDRKATPEEIVEKCKENIPILISNNELDIKLSGVEHLLIEGDNYQVLSSLTMIGEAEGIIDVIYIDPPYNTGNKDFTFNDTYIDLEDGFRHTKWLNFMEKRLRLSHELLKEDGIIFISIDDREYAQLKLLCDSIFGEKNYIATLKWKKKKQPSFLSRVADVIEYVLVYAKNQELIKKLSVETLSDSNKPIINASNQFSEILFKEGKRAKCSDRTIKAGSYQNRTMIIEYLDDIVIEKGRTKNDFRCKAQFRTSQENIDNFMKEDLIFITRNLGLRRDLAKSEKGGAKTITDLLLDWGQNQDGTNELKRIFNITTNKVPFSNPKPVLLIKNLIKSTMKDDAVVLDFFAGSGTTAQAVLELNKEDEGNRKFILCTNNENNIMHEVCYPRIKTVMTGIREDGTIYSEEKMTGNLLFFSSDFIEDHSSKDQSKYNLVEYVDSLLCIKESVFDIHTRNKQFNVYMNDTKTKTMAIYNDLYEEGKFENMLKIVKSNNTLINTVYYFSLDNNVDLSVEKKVKDLVPNVTVNPIPSKIYEIYKRIAGDLRRDY